MTAARPRYLPTALIALVAIVALTVLAACNGDGSTPATPTATLLAFQGSRGPVEKEGVTALPPIASPAETERYYEFYPPLLVDVHAGVTNLGTDLMVFEFTAARPGYRVEYVTPPITACGSGMEVTIAGDAFLQVRMTPAAAHDDAGQPTFGTNELLPGLPTLLEVQQTCDFEGIVTWVLGLSEEVDFVVSALPDPFRVVVDVAHPSN